MRIFKIFFICFLGFVDYGGEDFRQEAIELSRVGR